VTKVAPRMTKNTKDFSRSFELIAFDWDGTLYDSTAVIARCIQYAVSDVGGTVPDDTTASYVIGMNLRQALAHAAPDVPPAQYDELARRYQHHYRRHHDDLILFPGVIELLRTLGDRGHVLAVATGKSRRGLDEALDSLELEGLFRGSRTADETAGKPDPLMLTQLMSQFDVSPERTLMIGDTTHDLLMARAAGCASVGVSYGAHGGSELAEFNPRFIAHSVGELGEWLERNA
jgi:phosphoglycolate phosphatase